MNRLPVTQLLCLDSGPLGLLTHPQRGDEMIGITEWLSDCLRRGTRVILPAIVYFAVKRELLRAQKTIGIGRLDALVTAIPGRYLPLSDVALRLAAELWAKCRREGQPTADAKALDIDVIIAAQILSSEADMSKVVIATANPKHLSQFLS